MWDAIPETASRIRGRIESVLDWSKTRRYRDGDNPAAWRGNLKYVLASRDDSNTDEVEHHPTLAFDEMPEFIVALRVAQGGAGIAADGKVIRRIGLAALALEFTILTAARTGETVGARWSEINLTEKTWFIPKGRVKNGREHRVVLSDRCIEILQSLPKEDGNPHLFIGGKQGCGLSNAAMAQLIIQGKPLARASTTPGRLATVHGMRSSFKDWAVERTAYPNEMSEIALAHKVGSEVELAYRHGSMVEKRRRMMRDWERFCGSPKRDARVIPNDDLSREEWNNIGMAIWSASGGDKAGLDIFYRFSKKSNKHHNQKTVTDRWKHYFRSPPDRIGFGSLWYLATKADPSWEDRALDQIERRLFHSHDPNWGRKFVECIEKQADVSVLVEDKATPAVSAEAKPESKHTTSTEPDPGALIISSRKLVANFKPPIT